MGSRNNLNEHWWAISCCGHLNETPIYIHNAPTALIELFNRA